MIEIRLTIGMEKNEENLVTNLVTVLSGFNLWGVDHGGEIFEDLRFLRNVSQWLSF